MAYIFFLFFFQAEDGIRDFHVTGVQTCALPILFRVERRQRRAAAEQPRQVHLQARAQLALFVEEAHLFDVRAGKAQARVGLEFQALIQALLVQLRMLVAQPFQHQAHSLVEAVLADATAERGHSNGCRPMRGVHWYTSPCVLRTRSSWYELRLAYRAKNSLSTEAKRNSAPSPMKPSGSSVSSVRTPRTGRPRSRRSTC